MIEAKKTIKDITIQEINEARKPWRLKLNLNENIYGCSLLAQNALKNIEKEELSLYPCYKKLLDKLSKKYNLEDKNFLLTNGCDEAIKLIIETYLDKDDELITLNPTFFVPLLYAKANGAKIKQIEYEQKFLFRLDLISSNITSKTKMVYLATPNNPTGDIIRSVYVEELLAKFPNILFVIDCTYIDFSDKLSFLDFVDLVKKYNNVILLNSFSKFYALAGLRLGYAVAQKEIINNIKKITPLFNVNAIALHCAISAMNDEKFQDEIRENNQQARELLIEGLNKLGFCAYPSEANFVLCDFNNYCDFYYEKLKKNGVIVAKFKKDSVISNCLRITVPKVSGVKYILEILAKKDVLILDLDDVIFDVEKSYISAIKKTFEHFSNIEISLDEIKKIKNTTSGNCYWELVEKLLIAHGFKIEMSNIIATFQDFLYNPCDKSKKYLIDEEKLLISKEQVKELSKKYDMVIFSSRLKDEVIYSLEKNEIDEYFYYFITSDDLPKNMLKPNSKGVFEILKHCPFNSIKYVCGNIDDIIAANGANVEVVGVIFSDNDYNLMLNNFRHLGVKNIFNNVDDVVEFLK